MGNSTNLTDLDTFKEPTSVPDISKIPLAKVEGFIGRVFDFKCLFPSGLGADGWIAGSCVRDYLIGSKPPGDVAIFFRSEVEMVIYQINILKNDFEFKSVKCKDNVVNIETSIFNNTLKVQLVKSVFRETPEDVVNKFDYTISQFLIDENYLYCGNHSLKDLQDKRLRVHCMTYPISSMRRIIEYVKCGFVANNPDPTQILYLD